MPLANKLKLAFLLTFLAVSAIAICIGLDATRTLHLTIQPEPTADSPDHHTRLRITNDGESTIILEKFCAIFWTNKMNLPDHLVYKFSKTKSVLPRNSSQVVTIILPPDAAYFEASFPFQRKPHLPKKIYDFIRFQFGQLNFPENYSSASSPLIPNAAASPHSQ